MKRYKLFFRTNDPMDDERYFETEMFAEDEESLVLAVDAIGFTVTGDEAQFFFEDEIPDDILDDQDNDFVEENEDGFIGFVVDNA